MGLAFPDPASEQPGRVPVSGLAGPAVVGPQQGLSGSQPTGVQPGAWPPVSGLLRSLELALFENIDVVLGDSQDGKDGPAALCSHLVPDPC